MKQDISFSAKDAASLVEDYNNLLDIQSEQDYIDYIDVIAIITLAAKNGNSQTDFDDAMPANIIKKLRNQDFIVEVVSNQYEATYTKVSW